MVQDHKPSNVPGTAATPQCHVGQHFFLVTGYLFHNGWTMTVSSPCPRSETTGRAVIYKYVLWKQGENSHHLPISLLFPLLLPLFCPLAPCPPLPSVRSATTLFSCKWPSVLFQVGNRSTVNICQGLPSGIIYRKGKRNGKLTTSQYRSLSHWAGVTIGTTLYIFNWHEKKKLLLSCHSCFSKQIFLFETCVTAVVLIWSSANQDYRQWHRHGQRCFL